MSAKKISITTMALLMAASASSQDLFVKKSLFSQYEPATEKFQKIDTKNTVGDYPILKIGEEMQLMYSKVNYSTGVVVPLGRVAMFSERNKKYLVGLDITANLQQTNMSDWTDTPCKRENYLWKRSIGGEFKDVNCVTINHLVSFFSTPTGEFQQILVSMKDAGVEIPPTVLRTTFTRYEANGRRLVYVVDVNPEQYGVDRDATTPWGSNGWYKDFISRDPQRVEFLARLKKWAIDVQDRMDSAFKKDAKAFADLKPIHDYLTEKKAQTQGNAGDTQVVNLTTPSQQNKSE
ncbi:hypothetical protein MIZ03_1209 [Rhodoferax lithotrophicus]|uniref:Uncharacterized protein n=1 Tax=Rhodoferax lithotrophicus TaxID=2798804 RepID=A0ABN6D693_9BURK|nr:hypothetical protein [Rhodoferax sp. MIZ03]BCO26329.1 hypothetical protein MIZ03_1209 [Rhodoferax sp. MIZ03]